MAIAARLEESGGTRGAPRRTLRFATTGERAAGDARAVLVLNASATGLLLESEEPLAVGDAIDIDLPHAGITAAQVVWASGTLYGCRFDAAISDAALSAAELRSAVGAEIGVAGFRAGESLGLRIERLRKERGLTLAQLGELLAVSKPTIWAWEKGKAHPIESRMGPLADALGVPRSQLEESHEGGQQRELLDHSRKAIAHAFGTDPHKVRIMIEL